jgi:hypothetical protein
MKQFSLLRMWVWVWLSWNDITAAPFFNVCKKERRWIPKHLLEDKTDACKSVLPTITIYRGRANFMSGVNRVSVCSDPCLRQNNDHSGNCMPKICLHLDLSSAHWVMVQQDGSSQFWIWGPQSGNYRKYSPAKVKWRLRGTYRPWRWRVICCSETSADFHWTTQTYIPQHTTVLGSFPVFYYVAHLPSTTITKRRTDICQNHY